VQSFYPGQVVDVQVRKHADGSGDVLFATLDSGGIEGLPGFYGIADAQQIENLARGVLLRS
jgi:hypothetical protein